MLNTNFQKRFIDCHEVIRLIGIKKTYLYELIKKGEIKRIKNGRKTVFLESEAVEGEPVPKSADKLGAKVANWMGKMLSKAASGAWSISLTVATNTLQHIICKYYGL